MPSAAPKKMVSSRLEKCKTAIKKTGPHNGVQLCAQLDAYEEAQREAGFFSSPIHIRFLT